MENFEAICKELARHLYSDTEKSLKHIVQSKILKLQNTQYVFGFSSCY